MKKSGEAIPTIVRGEVKGRINVMSTMVKMEMGRIGIAAKGETPKITLNILAIIAEIDQGKTIHSMNLTRTLHHKVLASS
jgi:hypothetical protein